MEHNARSKLARFRIIVMGREREDMGGKGKERERGKREDMRARETASAAAAACVFFVRRREDSGETIEDNREPCIPSFFRCSLYVRKATARSLAR